MRVAEPPASGSTMRPAPTGGGVGRTVDALIPVRPAGSVERPRVYGLLEEACRHRLTVVCAGAGWGKTTSVCGWVASRTTGPPVAWLTLRGAHNDPASFWHAVLAGVAATGIVGEDHPIAHLTIAGGVSDEVHTRLHHAMRVLGAPLLLVLDDFQVIDDDQVLEVVARLVAQESPLRVMLLTRTDPVLPLHRLRLTGELAEVTAADLAFDAGELAAMAAGQRVALSTHDSSVLRSRTEGWPAGLRLAMLYLSRGQTGAGPEGFGGTERAVAEYLLAEVVDQQSASIRDFLLRTSVADRVCADLADAIVPGVDAQAALERLEDGSGFVTALGPDRIWYRYHTLLRDLLAHLLRRDDPHAFAQAHRDAAWWLAHHGQPVEGLRHAAAAEDWNLFEDIFTRVAGPSLVGAEREAVRRLLSTVPFGATPDRVALRLCAAGLAVTTGAVDEIAHHVVHVDGLISSGEVPTHPGEAILLELMRCAVGRRSGDGPAVLEAATGAVSMLDRADPFPARDGYRIIATNNLAIGRLWTADVSGAAATFTAMIRMPDPGDVGMVLIGAQAQLALCNLLQMRLGAARASADAVLAQAEARGWTSLLQVRPAHLTSAVVRLLQGDLDGADRAVASGLAADVGGTEPPLSLALLITQAGIAAARRHSRTAAHAADAAWQARTGWTPPARLIDELARMTGDVALLTGDLEWARARLDRCRQDVGDSPTVAASLARVALASADAATAVRLAMPVTEIDESGDYLDLVACVEAWVVCALAENALHHPYDALAALGRAVHLAGPHQLVRPFVATAPDQVLAMLPALADWMGGWEPFARGLHNRLAGTPSRTTGPAPLVETLTQRELAILAALPSPKTNSEIAEDFFVSVNTVKTHLKALYRKLGVSSRREAVQRSRELRLLP